MVFNGLLSESSEQASSHGRGSAAINSMAMQKHMDADVNLQFQLLMRKPVLDFIFASKKTDYFGDDIQVMQKKRKEEADRQTLYITVRYSHVSWRHSLWHWMW